MSEPKNFAKAKNYAYRLLRYRSRSVSEMSQRLRQKGFTKSIIKKTTAYLNRIGYLNDEEFAKTWVQAKLQSKSIGFSLLRYQLKSKGISEDVTDRVLAGCSDGYDELRAAKQLAACRVRAYKTQDPQVIKRRIYAYLRRRGFHQAVIYETLEAIK